MTAFLASVGELRGEVSIPHQGSHCAGIVGRTTKFKIIAPNGGHP